MTYLYKVLMKQTLFLISITALTGLFIDSVMKIFFHNLHLNMVIISSLLVGIILNFHQLQKIYREQKWLNCFEYGTTPFPTAPKIQILIPLKILLEQSSHSSSISVLGAQSVLNSVETRLDEARSMNRYLMGLLVFLGLLGTFWGLSETIGTIAGIINTLNLEGVEASQAFHHLKEGLQSPLTGMGIAFSSSLFGLASSLTLGFLDLQNGQASSGFYYTLEEKLMSLMAYHSLEKTKELSHYNGPAYSLSLLEQTLEGMTALQNHLRRSEDNRLSLVKAVQSLSEKLTQMAEQLIAHQGIIKTITHNQLDLQEGVKLWVQQSQISNQGELNHLRNLELTLAKLLEESIEGRNRLTQELRQEIRVIAKTLSAIANGQDVAA